jgi:hypothetical protein
MYERPPRVAHPRWAKKAFLIQDKCACPSLLKGLETIEFYVLEVNVCKTNGVCHIGILWNTFSKRGEEA